MKCRATPGRTAVWAVWPASSRRQRCRNAVARGCKGDCQEQSAERPASWPGRRSAIHAVSGRPPMPKEMPTCRARPCRTSIDTLRDRQKASASQAPPTLEERRAAFTPGDRLHPVPDDVVVSGGDRWRGASPLACRPRNGRRPGAPVPARRRLRARVGAQRRRVGRPAGTGQRDAGAVPRISPGPRASLPRRHRRRPGRLALAPHRPGPERTINSGGR